MKDLKNVSIPGKLSWLVLMLNSSFTHYTLYFYVFSPDLILGKFIYVHYRVLGLWFGEIFTYGWWRYGGTGSIFKYDVDIF